MALDKNQVAVTWPTAQGSVTLNTANHVSSEAITYSPNVIGASVQVSADNQGTPTSGDIVEVYWASTNGDLDGNASNDFDTNEHATPLGVIDTVPANTPGENPATKSFPLPVDCLGGKVVLRAPQGASRSIVARARIVESRAA